MKRKVAVLLSTYNGEKYLPEQIDSILKQKGVDVSLFIRDDGSTDNTLSILKKYVNNYKNIHVIFEQNIGYAKSFLKLLLLADKSDYYAFSDQDDIWDKDKLFKAIDYLESNTQDIYASCLKVVDENKNYISYKKFDNFRGTMGSVISRNRLSGCTMVFNYNLKKIMEDYVPEILKIDDIKYGHDGWLLLIHLLHGGSIFVDNNSFIQYRRHSDAITLINKNKFKRAKFEFKMLFLNKNKRVKIAKFLINNVKNIQDDDNIELLREICNYKKSFSVKLKLLMNSNIKTGIRIVDFLNKIAIMFGTY